MAGPSSSGHDEQTMTLLVIAAALAVALFAISRMQEEINAISGALSWLCLWPFAMAVDHVPSLRSLPVLGGFFQDVELATQFLAAGNFAYMSPAQRLAVLSVSGRAILPVLLPFMAWAAFALRKLRVDQAHRRSYTLDTMIHAQSEHWSTSRLVRHVNPLEQPETGAAALARAVSEPGAGRSVGRLVVDPGRQAPALPWQRAMRPEEWLVAGGLAIDQNVIERAKAVDWRMPDQDMESRHLWKDLDLDSLMEVLAGQLRRAWTGHETLRPCLKALLAVLAHFHAYELEEGRTILDDLGRLVDAIQARPGLDEAILAEPGFMGRIEAVLANVQGQGLMEVASRHAWLESAFPAMLAAARYRRGVLPPATFLWLKTEDRALWYVLDSVGSEAVMVEAAGAMSHYRAEMQIGAPIRRPAVYQAARALLEDYLDITPERVRRSAEKADRALAPGERIDAVATGSGARMHLSGRGLSSLLIVILVAGLLAQMAFAWNLSVREERVHGAATTLADVIRAEAYGLHHWLHRERVDGLNEHLPLQADTTRFLDADENARLAADPAVTPWRRAAADSTRVIMPRGWTLVRMIARTRGDNAVEDAVLVLRAPVGAPAARLAPVFLHLDSLIAREGGQAETLATTAFAVTGDAVPDFDPDRDRAFLASKFARIDSTIVLRDRHAGQPRPSMATDLDVPDIFNINSMTAKAAANDTLFAADCDGSSDPIEAPDSILSCQMALRMAMDDGRGILDCLDAGGTLVDETACHGWLDSDVIDPILATFERKSGHILNALNANDVCTSGNASHDAWRCQNLEALYGRNWWDGFTSPDCGTSTHASDACRAAKLTHLREMLRTRLVDAAPSLAPGLCARDIRSAACLEWVIHAANVPTGGGTPETFAESCRTAGTTSAACARLVGVLAGALPDPDMLCAAPMDGVCRAWISQRATMASWSPEELCRPLYDHDGSGSLCDAALGSATDPKRHAFRLGPHDLCRFEPGPTGDLPRRACLQARVMDMTATDAEKEACHAVRAGTATSAQSRTCHDARMQRLNAYWSGSPTSAAPHIRYDLPALSSLNVRYNAQTGRDYPDKSLYPVGTTAGDRTSWEAVRMKMGTFPGWPSATARSETVAVAGGVRLADGLAQTRLASGSDPAAGGARVGGVLEIEDGGTLMTLNLVSDGDMWLGPARDASGLPVWQGDPGYVVPPGIPDPDAGPLLNFDEMTIVGTELVVDVSGNFLTDGTLALLHSPRTAFTTAPEDMSTSPFAGTAVFTGTTSGTADALVADHELDVGTLNVSGCFRSVIPFFLGPGCGSAP
ncbi:MAG: hypothetical protein F4213_03280 [Boseongicola sp. SB0677_bin_26]|nr:hypothetical protein [Boseongicola sp. SB0665_bin_10]MYG25037.1 hypothetical protein [Boseongicola sp. SB0677_bin_26]